jgi:hypothetical protein
MKIYEVSRKFLTYQNLFYCFVGYACIKMFVLNIDLRDVWLDESGQFWISQGQNHFSSWDSPSTGLGSVFLANRDANLDPGGYSFLLRVWSGIFGQELDSLRTLSFIFWFGSLAVCLYMSSKILNRNPLRFLSSIAICTAFFSNPVKWYAFEIRAYSMSLFGTCLLALAIYLLLKYETTPYIVLFVLSSLFVVVGRYQGVVFNAAACLLVSIHFLKRRKFAISTLLIMPVTLLQVFLYFSTTKFQNKGQPPSYVTDLLLKSGDQEKFLETFKTNWFDGYGFFVGALLLITIILKLLRLLRVIDFPNDSVQLLMRYVIICQFLLISFSVAGFLPWNLNTRWSLNDYSIVALSIVLLLSTVETILNAEKFKKLDLNVSWVKNLSFGLIFFVSLSLAKNKVEIDWVRTDGKNIVATILNESCKSSTTYLDGSIYPDARYFAKVYLDNMPSDPLKFRDFKLFQGVKSLDGVELDYYKPGACLIMSKNWDPTTDEQNRMILLASQFLEVRDYNRDFGGLGWILFKKSP